MLWEFFRLIFAESHPLKSHFNCPKNMGFSLAQVVLVLDLMDTICWDWRIMPFYPKARLGAPKCALYAYARGNQSAFRGVEANPSFGLKAK